MRLVRVAINAVALFIAALLVPGIRIEWSEDASVLVVTLVALALLFGLVNTFIRPIARVVSIPLNIATLGFFSVILNAVLLLAVAFLADLVWPGLISIGGYPPDLSIEAIGSAAVGAFIIGAITTAMNVLIPDT
jgi:putative membrane protein